MTHPNETREKIKKFGNVVQGWYFGEGVIPENKIIDLALKINNAMLVAGFQDTDAFLGAAGEIQVNAYADEIYIETVIDNDTGIEIIYEKNDKVQFQKDDLSISNAIATIEFWGKQWAILDLFTKTTMITKNIDLQVLPYHYLPMVAFQLLTQNASNQMKEESVNILGSTTLESPMSPQSFLNSTRQFSRINAST